MNLWNGIGNLTRNPEVSYKPGNDPLAIAKMTIAINDGYGEKQRTDYINITCFGRLAENCEKYLSKGSKIAVAGKIQTGSYEKDGKKVYTTDIIASNIEFLGGIDSRLP